MIQRTIFEEKKPKITGFYPEWWHGHGTKMQVERLDIENQTLTLKASAARVKIISATKLFPGYPRKCWFVEWEVVLLRPTDLAAKVD